MSTQKFYQLTTQSYADEANKLKTEGKLNEAIEKYLAALKLNSDCIPALNQLAAIYEDRKEFDLAITYLQKRIDLEPNNSQAQIRIATILKKQGKIKEAIAAYKQAFIFDKYQPVWVYNQFANTLEQNSEINEAIDKYNLALELNPGFIPALSRLGEIYQSRNQLDRAIACYQQAIATPQKSAADCKGLAYNLGKILTKQGQLSKAIVVYQKILGFQSVQELNPEKAEGLHSRLGEITIELSIVNSQLHEAVNFFKRAINDYKNNPWHYYHLAVSFTKLGKLDRAITYYRKAIKVSEHKVFYYGYRELGKALEEKGLIDKAFDCYMTALQVKPDSTKTNFYCTSWFSKSKNKLSDDEFKKKAILYKNTVDSQVPSLKQKTSIPYISIGKILMRAGMVSEAIAYNQKASFSLISQCKPDYVDKYWKKGTLKKPSFFIIGVMKCGTTSLYDYMIQHPNILPSIIKEPKDWGLARPQAEVDENLNYYLSFFPPIPDKSNFLTGEASTAYIFHPVGVENIIKNYFPDSKLIVILRNPVKRLISQYNHWLKLVNEKRSLENIIESEIREIETIQEPAVAIKSAKINQYLVHGLYVYFIQKWMQVIPKNNFLILNSEDLGRNPNVVLKKVFNFLGTTNYSSINYKLKNKRSYANTIDKQLCFRLQEFYKPHNQKLEEFIGQKFHWD